MVDAVLTKADGPDQTETAEESESSSRENREFYISIGAASRSLAMLEFVLLACSTAATIYRWARSSCAPSPAIFN